MVSFELAVGGVKAFECAWRGEGFDGSGVLGWAKDVGLGRSSLEDERDRLDGSGGGDRRSANRTHEGKDC